MNSFESEKHLSKEDLILRWMDRGCPCFLDAGDDIARPLGDVKSASACYRRGLAALDGVEQDGKVWRRKSA